MEAIVGQEEITKRVASVTLTATSFADERLLMAIVEVLMGDGRITAKPRRRRALRWQTIRAGLRR